MLPRPPRRWTSWLAFVTVLVLAVGACGEEPGISDVLRDIRSVGGDWSARDEWPLAQALLVEDEYWDRFSADIELIDPVDAAGNRWLDGRRLLIPDRRDEPGLLAFSNWFDDEFKQLDSPQPDYVAVLQRVWFGIRDPGAVIADDCQGRLRPAARECPPIDEFVEQVTRRVGETGPLEWGVMSQVMIASDPLLGGLIRSGYFETIPIEDADGVQRVADYGRVPFSVERIYIPGNLIIPPFDDDEAMASFGAWFDETFLADPDSPYYVYVEGPAQAYREMLYETLEFCQAEPERCGDVTPITSPDR